MKVAGHATKLGDETTFIVQKYIIIRVGYSLYNVTVRDEEVHDTFMS